MAERGLADAIHVPCQHIADIISGEKSMTASMSPDFWLNLQLRWDLYQTQQAESEALETIRPHVAA